MLIYDILVMIQSFLDIKRTVLFMQEFLAKIGFASLIHTLCAPLLFYKTTCLNIYDARPHDDGVSDHIKDGGIQITQNLHMHYHNCGAFNRCDTN